MPTHRNALPTEETILSAAPEGSRLRFSGPPGSLRGTIPLVNNGTDKQKIRVVGIKAEKLKGPAGLPLREVPLFARLLGGQQANVRLSIALDPRTAPGTYDFELNVGSKALPATAQVSEVVDFRVDPSAVTILTGSATSHTKTFTFENAGNVPLPTGAECEAPLFDSYDLLTSLVIGLHHGDKSSAESLARAFLSQWGDLQVGTVVAKRKPIVLEPGQKVTAEVEFVLPPKLKPLRRYRANLQLYNAPVSVDVYTSADYGSGREHKESRR
jgi:hypothetical protein